MLLQPVANDHILYNAVYVKYSDLADLETESSLVTA